MWSELAIVTRQSHWRPLLAISSWRTTNLVNLLVNPIRQLTGIHQFATSTSEYIIVISFRQIYWWIPVLYSLGQSPVPQILWRTQLAKVPTPRPLVGILHLVCLYYVLFVYKWFLKFMWCDHRVAIEILYLFVVYCHNTFRNDYKCVKKSHK